MSQRLVRDFPLFPLALVALPFEAVPLHIFEQRYLTMVEGCLEREAEFGIVWRSDTALREVGCACRIAEVLERTADGHINLVARGTRPFQIRQREPRLPYPAGVVELLDDAIETADEAAGERARAAYGDLVEQATDERPEAESLESMSAYAMAATVDFGLDAKQGLLELRSENSRLRFVTRLFRAASKRLRFVDRAQARARSNGKVRFS